MAVTARDILFIMRAQDFASREVDRVGRAFADVDKHMQSVRDNQKMIRKGGGLLAAGAGLAVMGGLGLGGLAGAATHYAELETALRYVQTQMPEVNASLGELQQIVDDISTTIPVARDEITQAMYDIASSVDFSDDVAVAKKELRDLTMLFSAAAVAGQTEVDTVAKLGIGLANAYNTGFGKMGAILSQTFSMVRFGIGEYEDFAQVMGRTAATASGLGQDIQTVAGSFILLTRGFQRTPEAAASIGRFMEQIFRPETLNNIKEMGVKVVDANGNLRQLNEVMTDLYNTPAFKALSEEGRLGFLEAITGREGRVAARRFDARMRENIELYNDFVERVGSTEVDTGAMIEAFETMYGSTETSIMLMKNSWAALVDTIGKDVIDTFARLIRNVTEIINYLREMDPETRKSIVNFIMWGSALALVSGTVIALSGAFLMLAGTIGILFGLTGAAAVGWAAALVVGVPAAIYLIYKLVTSWGAVKEGWADLIDFIGRGVSSVGNAMSAFVRVVADALIAVYNVVVAVGKATYEALQLFNPFARFSPSLVDNVKAGVDIIVAKYKELRGIIPAIDSARAAVQRLRDAAQSLAAAQADREQAEITELLGLAGQKAIAAYAEAERAIERLRQEQEKIIPIYRRESEELKRLEGALDKVQFEYDTQKQAVEALERSQDALNYELQLQERTLDRIGDSLDEAKTNFNAAQNAVDDITRSIQDAERAMQDFAQAPLTGQGEFEDKMFALEQQALAVRKEMTKWKAAGAPPEAMDFFNLQLDEIQNKMDKLQIERDIEIEPLRRELEKLADTNQELTFEEAREGILNSQKEIDRLEKALPGATKELEKQQKIVDKLQESFDAQEKIVDKYREQLEALRDSMEDENRVLELIAERLEIAQDAYEDQEKIVKDLEGAYGNLSDEINTLEGAMDTILESAREQKRALEEAAGAASDFAEALAELDTGPLGQDMVPAGIEDLDLSGLESITEKVDTFVRKIETIREFFSWLFSADSWRDIGDFWYENGGIFTAYVDWFNGIGPAIGNFFGSIDTGLRDAGEAIAAFNSGVWNNVEGWVEDLGKWWRETKTGFSRWLDDMNSGLTNWLPDWRSNWDNMRFSASNTLTGIRKTIEEKREPILAALRLIMFIATGNWGAAWGEIQRLTGKGVDDAANKITEKKPSVLEAAGKLANYVVSGISGLPLRLATAAGRAVQEFINGVQNKFADIKEVALRLVRRFLQAFNEMNPTSLGKNFVQGLIDGLDSKIDELDKKAKEAADTVTRRVHDGWMVGSPSRLAQYYGQMFGAGLGLGISDMEREVVNEAMSITRAAANALDPSQVNGTGAGFPSPVGQNRGAGSTRQVNVTIESGAFSVNIDGNADESVTTEIENKLQEFLDDLSDELRTGSKGTL